MGASMAFTEMLSDQTWNLYADLVDKVNRSTSARERRQLGGFIFGSIEEVDG
ncbi:hypothetical protein ACFPYJ_26200 [Paenibacillus solisilvae]|uniref:Uncharacterized protein n=1 Tax=Paenibacillus solisilvae TaxID=2486751 RepID=A0ABW0W533_9BACL